MPFAAAQEMNFAIFGNRPLPSTAIFATQLAQLILH
jgi:hypothetical protein